MNVEKISAITIKVNDGPSLGSESYPSRQASEGKKSKRFHRRREPSGLAACYRNAQTLPYLTPVWGRIIFYVEDVDRFWAHMKEKEFGPARPQDAAWGERYFQLVDPDGHELSFAQPIR